MFRSVDVKSLLIGGLLVLSVVCLVGALPYMSPEYYGRFRIEVNPSHAFVLDSATGQVWSIRVSEGRANADRFADPNTFLAPKL